MYWEGCYQSLQAIHQGYYCLAHQVVHPEEYCSRYQMVIATSYWLGIDVEHLEVEDEGQSTALGLDSTFDFFNPTVLKFGIL